MKIIADLHIHSRYSRGCSSKITVKELEKWARVKGIGLLGTGDFSQPDWFDELKSELSEDGTGILRTKNNFPFVLQNEISLIYSQGGKGRRVHLVVLAPSFKVVEQITDYLKSKGRVDYDGRPIFNIPCDEFVKEMKNISDDIEVIPAHVWTPWFSLFGSKSGFDSVKQAFGDQARHIHALETGLSSDPEMNWQISGLDDYNLVSFSDSHSFWPWRLGREATVFELEEFRYEALLRALRTGEGLAYTIEVDPNYGKYHYDGHRKCGVSMAPAESSKHNNICPVCKKPLTIGVLNRVSELADRKPGFRPEQGRSFKRIIPLHELISLHMNAGISTKKVWAEYYELLKLGKNEFDILLNVPEEKLLSAADEKLVELIMLNREGRLGVRPGFDGEYGVPLVGKVKKPAPAPGKAQTGLGDYL